MDICYKRFLFVLLLLFVLARITVKILKLLLLFKIHVPWAMLVESTKKKKKKDDPICQSLLVIDDLKYIRSHTRILQGSYSFLIVLTKKLLCISCEVLICIKIYFQSSVEQLSNLRGKADADGKEIGVTIR